MNTRKAKIVRTCTARTSCGQKVSDRLPACDTQFLAWLTATSAFTNALIRATGGYGRYKPAHGIFRQSV